MTYLDSIVRESYSVMSSIAAISSINSNLSNLLRLWMQVNNFIYVGKGFFFLQ